MSSFCTAKTCNDETAVAAVYPPQSNIVGERVTFSCTIVGGTAQTIAQAPPNAVATSSAEGLTSNGLLIASFSYRAAQASGAARSRLAALALLANTSHSDSCAAWKKLGIFPAS